MSAYSYVTVATIFGVVLSIAMIVGVVLYYRSISIAERKAAERVKGTIFRLTSGVAEVPADMFIRMRETYGSDRRDGKLSNQSEFTGIYIIHNVTRDMYYVGQSKNVLRRISAHLRGAGNGDVYADLVYGDAFTVQAIPLSTSGYISLDALERDTIQVYGAYEYGYNKNRGNGR